VTRERLISLPHPALGPGAALGQRDAGRGGFLFAASVQKKAGRQVKRARYRGQVGSTQHPASQLVLDYDAAGTPDACASAVTPSPRCSRKA
jgi:hypothetical protein